jgi:hypothetical protein
MGKPLISLTGKFCFCVTVHWRPSRTIFNYCNTSRSLIVPYISIHMPIFKVESKSIPLENVLILRFLPTHPKAVVAYNVFVDEIQNNFSFWLTYFGYFCLQNFLYILIGNWGKRSIDGWAIIFCFRPRHFIGKHFVFFNTFELTMLVFLRNFPWSVALKSTWNSHWSK